MPDNPLPGQAAHDQVVIPAIAVSGAGNQIDAALAAGIFNPVVVPVVPEAGAGLPGSMTLRGMFSPPADAFANPGADPFADPGADLGAATRAGLAVPSAGAPPPPGVADPRARPAVRGLPAPLAPRAGRPEPAP